MATKAQTGRGRPRPTAKPQPSSSAKLPAWWRNKTLGYGLLGGALLWAALPPLAWEEVAWIAPMPWLLLARHAELPGRHPYRLLWLASFAFWMVAIYWVMLPFWADFFGLVALAFYLAFYLPLFVFLVRVATFPLHLSIIIAAPVVWTGLELARAHLLTGFLLAALGHTQYRWIELIQISDFGGSYAVSFLVMLVAACVARALPCQRSRRVLWPALPAAAALAATLAYGHWRLDQDTTRPGPTVALIQGSIDTTIKTDPAEADVIFDQYMNLSRQAVRQEPQIDLIVWPETMFRVPYHTMSSDHVSPRDAEISTESLCERSRAWIEATVHELGDYPMLIGLDAINHTRDGQDSYNAALFADRDGRCLGCYHKVHLVMFGEYVPLAGYFPWLYALTPLSGGATPGAGPHATTVGDVRYAPNICYESTVPHLIRDQVNQLRDESREPDILVNLTNDGWFRGSSALDMHLICGVFRAVECRKPFLVAANTGFSAWIDSDGRIRAQGPRRETDVVIARPRLDSRRAPYLVYGDTLAGACLAACGVLALVGLWQSDSVGRVFYRLRRASNS